MIPDIQAAYCLGAKSQVNPMRPHGLCVGCRHYLYAAEGMKPLIKQTPDGWECVNLAPMKAEAKAPQ